MSPSSDSSESNGPDKLSREGMNSLQKKDQASENNSEASFGVKTTPDFIPMVRIIFWNSMGFFFFSYLIPFVARELLGASYAQLGLLFSIQTTGGLISAPIVAFLTDRYSKKLLVLIGSSGRAACYFLMYLGIIVSNLYVFGAGMFVLGFFVGFFWTPLNALISQKANKRNRSAAFTRRRAG